MNARRVADIIALAKLGWDVHKVQRDAAGGVDPPNHGEWLLINNLVTALTECQNGTNK